MVRQCRVICPVIKLKSLKISRLSYVIVKTLNTFKSCEVSWDFIHPAFFHLKSKAIYNSSAKNRENGKDLRWKRDTCWKRWTSALHFCTVRSCKNKVLNLLLKFFLADTSPFVGPLMTLFWTSGDISPGCQSQTGWPSLACFVTCV